VAEVVPSNIALWKPFTGKGTSLLRRDIICVHTMVGSLSGSYSWASGAGRSYWHFGTSGTGECWQCQGLEYRSAANLEGNPYVIPIENADHGPGFGAWSGRCGDVPPFTQAQVDKLVQLIAHLCRRFNIPATFIPDTRVGRRGIAWHRQGIPGWPEWQGGLLWSSSVGKCCPDWRRINQLKTVIVPRVQAVLAGTNPPPEEDKFAMAMDKKTFMEWFNEALDNHAIITGIAGGPRPWYGRAFEFVYNGARDATATRALVTNMAKKIDALDDINEAEIAAAVLEGFDPAEIAAAIPADLAERVADELAARLAS
jgi:hypothetical protein